MKIRQARKIYHRFCKCNQAHEHRPYKWSTLAKAHVLFIKKNKRIRGKHND